MSNLELLFFMSFLAGQLLLPARRYLYAAWHMKPVTHLMRYYTFSWTMRLRGIGGSIRLRIYDRKTGRTLKIVDLEKVLFAAQVKYILGAPRALLPIVKTIEEKLKRDGLQDFGINAFMVVGTTHTETQELIDSSVDLTQEEIKLFGPYKWDLRDEA